MGNFRKKITKNFFVEFSQTLSGGNQGNLLQNFLY
jgi:hypothetical protein